MARPCDCDGPCLGGRYGAYTVLVHRAQADTDQAHRQQAMALIATIAPMAGSLGADGSCPGDGAAAGILNRLYPDDEPRPQQASDYQAAIAEIEADALRRTQQIIDDYRKNAVLSSAKAG